MSTTPGTQTTDPVPPPTKHQLALMIWLCVFPTLLGLNLLFGEALKSIGAVPRTFVLATIAVPIVIYGLMPQLHKSRIRILPRSHHRSVGSLPTEST